MVAVNNLILPTAYVSADSGVTDEAEAAPQLFVPEKPALVAATQIHRPWMEAALIDWEIEPDHADRIDVSTMDSAGFTRRHIPNLPPRRVTIRGTAVDGSVRVNELATQRPYRLKLYVVAEPI
jgi:hypothetical protein